MIEINTVQIFFERFARHENIPLNHKWKAAFVKKTGYKFDLGSPELLITWIKRGYIPQNNINKILSLDIPGDLKKLCSECVRGRDMDNENFDVSLSKIINQGFLIIKPGGKTSKFEKPHFMYCKEHEKPYVTARIKNRYAKVEIDYITCEQKCLDETGHEMLKRLFRQYEAYSQKTKEGRAYMVNRVGKFYAYSDKIQISDIEEVMARIADIIINHTTLNNDIRETRPLNIIREPKNTAAPSPQKENNPGGGTCADSLDKWPDNVKDACRKLKEIYDSGDIVLVEAIQANLNAFKRALIRERQIAEVEKKQTSIQEQLQAMEKKMRRLEEENKSLKGCAGDSPPLNLSPGKCGPTGTEKPET